MDGAAMSELSRAVICVATTDYYRRGLERLERGLGANPAPLSRIYPWGSPTWDVPPEWPTHKDKPYAFKAYALKQAADTGSDLLLWADACMLPVQSMEPLWERIERDGYWMSANGYSNYEWTADSAYRDLFSPDCRDAGFGGGERADAHRLEELRMVNRGIPHVVATCFGLNVKHPKGRAFLDEYYRLASETRAFCGPWTNTNYQNPNPVVCSPLAWTTPQPCGPADVRGHRHDQTAASVIAWRLGFDLTNPPEIFAYGKAGEAHDPRTIMIADGSYA